MLALHNKLANLNKSTRPALLQSAVEPFRYAIKHNMFNLVNNMVSVNASTV